MRACVRARWERRGYSQARVCDGDDHTVGRLALLLHHPVEPLVQALPPVGRRAALRLGCGRTEEAEDVCGAATISPVPSSRKQLSPAALKPSNAAFPL